MDREKGGIYGLRDKCTKTSRHVLEIMRGKHPELMIPAKQDFDKYKGINIPKVLKPMSLFIFEENVSTAAVRLH